MASHDEDGLIPASSRREQRVMVIDPEPERRKTLAYGKPAAEVAVTLTRRPVVELRSAELRPKGAFRESPPTQPPRVRAAPDARMRQVLSPTDVIDALRDEVLRLRRRKRDE
jgi:hypothetical protein